MLRWLVVGALAGCYRPATEAPCSVNCETPGEASACPGELECGSDLRCHAAGAQECSQLDDGGLPEVCVGHAFVQVCFRSKADVTISGLFDTDSSDLCGKDVTAAGSTAACIIVGKQITLLGLVDVSGERPLVLAASSVVNIRGTLDVASHNAPLKEGPGSSRRAGGCTMGTAGGDGVSGKAGGGGAGGSYVNPGAPGGAPGVATSPVPVMPPSSLVTACAATRGGREGAGSFGGRGQSGGVVAVIASTISLSSGSAINASGAGGLPGGVGLNGGGGGGAGGLVLLDGDLEVSGVVIADGGGGGGGSIAGTAGQPGQDPDPTTPVPAEGGPSGGTGAGKGGNGGRVSMDPSGGGAGTQTGGGGGGGGGVTGVIYVVPTLPTDLDPYSPIPAPPPST